MATLDRAHEGVARQDSAVPSRDSQKELSANDRAPLQIDDRLGIQRESIHVQRLLDLYDHGTFVGYHPQDPLISNADAFAMTVLDQVHDALRLLHQAFYGSGTIIYRDAADACRDLE